MRVVIALGGNALIQRGQAMSADVQRTNIRTAAQGLARVAKDHQLIVSHGNGPQVGLLALQAAAYPDVDPYPLDILGAETQGMIGYLLEQELGNVLPFEVPLATILSMVEVDPDDPAFGDPTKFVGPIYDEATAKALAAEKGWTVKPDGEHWRRVVPSPALAHLRAAADEVAPRAGVLIICAGGGGIPTMYARGENRHLVGVEAVVDKDLAGSLLARDLEADLYVMATDVDGVYLDWGTPNQRRLDRATTTELESGSFPAGSMGPRWRPRSSS